MNYRNVPRERFLGRFWWGGGWRAWVPRWMRRVSLLMYSRGPVNYTSSCQLVICGDSAWIDTLNGKDFYRLLQQIGMQPFRELGLCSVEAAVSAPHLRRIRIALEDVLQIREVGNLVVDGHDLVRIEFTAPVTK